VADYHQRGVYMHVCMRVRVCVCVFCVRECWPLSVKLQIMTYFSSSCVCVCSCACVCVCVHVRVFLCVCTRARPHRFLPPAPAQTTITGICLTSVFDMT